MLAKQKLNREPSPTDPKKDISSHPRLEPFSPGQVYHAGKAKQMHVLAPATKESMVPAQ